ncbi:MAG: hypothetical protein IPG98_04790 [Burkholderiales bacterium]|nr:hypothetical protein [Burkholderiales bacterium]MBK8667744.1 hypothetical protein [Burkholderiales bacterium]
MDILSNDYPQKILGRREGPCLSLYQPTHRQFPQRQQDPIRFRNLVKKLEDSLRQQYSDRDIAPLLAPFIALADDADFWNHNADGLAVLGAADMFGVYRLQRPVEELAIVADSFHTKPLLRIVQSADRYHILVLSRHSARLFEGNRDRVDEIALAAEVPRQLDDVRVREFERDRAMRTHGRVEPGAMGRHGASDAKQDGIDAETEKFFREVDRAVLEHHSRPSGLPLLLAALPEHHPLLRKVSHNPQLMDASLDVDASQLSLDELRERAWTLVQPRYLDRLASLIDAFAAAEAKQQGSGDLSDVARAATEGRVATLLLEADRHIPGRIDAETGALTDVKLDDPRIDDMLDDLGERVLRSGGEVVIVPAERMPTKSGLAATYRF